MGSYRRNTQRKSISKYDAKNAERRRKEDEKLLESLGIKKRTVAGEG